MLKGLTFGKLRAKTPIPPHLKRYREHFKIYLHIFLILRHSPISVSYTHLRAHETPEHLVCRLLLEKKNHLSKRKRGRV